MVEKEIQHVIDHKDEKEVILQAVKENGVLLEWASKSLQDDKEVVLEAVKNDRRSIRICK